MRSLRRWHDEPKPDITVFSMPSREVCPIVTPDGGVVFLLPSRSIRREVRCERVQSLSPGAILEAVWLDMCDVPSRPSCREAWFAQLHGVPARYVCGVFMAMQTLRPWILSTAGCNALRRMRSREGVARQPPRVCGLPVRPICSARSCGKLPRMPTWQACTHFGTCAVHVRSL